MTHCCVVVDFWSATDLPIQIIPCSISSRVSSNSEANAPESRGGVPVDYEQMTVWTPSQQLPVPKEFTIFYMI